MAGDASTPTEDAGKPDVPGLHIARQCEYFWPTVPYLGRDPKRMETLDSRGPDHAADAALWVPAAVEAMQRIRIAGA